VGMNGGIAGVAMNGLLDIVAGWSESRALYVSQV
jgi:hypothetical protein